MAEKIALGVCSSVSIYKACEVLRGFQKEGIKVRVIMTKNATKLISPLLFEALSGEKVWVDCFEGQGSESLAHVILSQEIALLVVAPATANIIGKFASGIGDDFLSTFFMAVRCPVLIAPAMNEEMFFHTQTQKNIRSLKEAGVYFVEPEKGYLACGEEGWGRLAPPELVVEEGLRLIRKKESLKGRILLITAGPTREPLDPVRFLSNRSSGKMGYALASEALQRGAEVILISGPTQLFPPRGAKFVSVETTQEMAEEVEKAFPRVDVVIMAAAVADFAFQKTSAQKIKKERIPQKVELLPTPDILRGLGRNKGNKLLVGFAAETERLVEKGLGKMKEKNLDLLVANDVSREGVGFGSDWNEVVLISREGKISQTERMSKLQISRRILDEIEVLLGQK